MKVEGRLLEKGQKISGQEKGRQGGEGLEMIKTGYMHIQICYNETHYFISFYALIRRRICTVEKKKVKHFKKHRIRTKSIQHNYNYSPSQLTEPLELREVLNPEAALSPE